MWPSTGGGGATWPSGFDVAATTTAGTYTTPTPSVLEQLPAFLSPSTVAYLRSATTAAGVLACAAAAPAHLSPQRRPPLSPHPPTLFHPPALMSAAAVASILDTARARADAVRAEAHVLQFQARMATAAADAAAAAAGTWSFETGPEADALAASFATAYSASPVTPGRMLNEGRGVPLFSPFSPPLFDATASATSSSSPASASPVHAWFIPQASATVTLPAPVPPSLAGARSIDGGLVPPLRLVGAAVVEISNRSRATLRFTLYGPSESGPSSVSSPVPLPAPLPFVNLAAALSLGPTGSWGGGEDVENAAPPAGTRSSLIGVLRNAGAAEPDGAIVVPPLSDGRIYIALALPNLHHHHHPTTLGSASTTPSSIPLLGWTFASVARTLSSSFAVSAGSGGGGAQPLRVIVSERLWIAAGWSYDSLAHALVTTATSDVLLRNFTATSNVTQTLRHDTFPLSPPRAPARIAIMRTVHRAPPAGVPVASDQSDDFSAFASVTAPAPAAPTSASAPAPALAPPPARAARPTHAAQVLPPTTPAPAPSRITTAAAKSVPPPTNGSFSDRLNVTVSPTLLDFGSVRLGSIGVVTFDIQNFEPTRDIIVDVDVGGGGGAFYINSAHRRFVVEARRFSRLKVRFAPSRFLDAYSTSAGCVLRGSITLAAALVPGEGAGRLGAETPVALLPGAIARGAALQGALLLD